MPLLNVLSPEVLGFEELGAFRDLAPVLGLILLLYKLGELFVHGLFHRSTTQLLQVDVFWFQNL